jgi:N-acetylglucosamine malate deacetylase 1
MNPYLAYLERLSRLITDDGARLPLGAAALPPAAPVPTPAADAPVLLIMSPHPDDECIIGGLPLRLARERGFRIVNLAVTQGSKRARQQERREELAAACARLGFELVTLGERGLEQINPRCRVTHQDNWRAAVAQVAEVLARYRPLMVAFPHAQDYNTTHIGVHLLAREAMASLGQDFACLTLETEFWQPMAEPNLLVELTLEQAAELQAALACHVGELQRNPYHLSMPAWLQDCHRRGAEVVLGQGGQAPGGIFATLYRLRLWRSGKFHPIFPGGQLLATGANLDLCCHLPAKTSTSDHGSELTDWPM